MKRIFAAILGLLTVVSVSAQKKISDPNAVVRDVKGFTAIHLSNAFDVYLSQGADEAVAVSAGDASEIPNIRTEVKNGELFIDYDNKSKKWKGNKKLKAYISFKTLTALHVSGACDVFTDGTISSDKLVLKQSGASDVKINLNVRSLKIDLSGASDLTVSGNVKSLDVDASGASTMKGYDLKTDVCSAKASGASDVQITVNGELSANASGASDITYKGEGTVRELKTSGASSVAKRK